MAGSWRLTTAERKRILLNSIYGVDIDQQAVEVTKLSLLLKVLEDESAETITGQRTLGTERALPSLHKNIRCGNSLIGRDVIAAGPLTDEEIRRINPFDWDKGFPAIMAAGGFDAVIGNPPYVRQELISSQKDYLKSHYQVFAGTADLYTYFIERALSLMNERGQFAYIVANKWMRANYGKPLRQFLKTRRIEEIVDFGDLRVFENATTYPCIIRIAGGEPTETFSATNVESLQFEDLKSYVKEQHSEVRPDLLEDSGWSLHSDASLELVNRLRSTTKTLNDYVKGHMYWGIKTGLNKAFVIDGEVKNQLISEDPKSDKIIKPLLAGRDCKRYAPLSSNKFVIFARHGIEINQHPAIENYLRQFKRELVPRPANWTGGSWPGRKPGPYRWYEIQDPVKCFQEFEKQKIVYPEISSKPEFSLDNDGYYCNNKCFVISGGDKYLLGILNSSLFSFLFSVLLPRLQGGFFSPASVIFKDFPIRPIDPANPNDVAKHDRMVALVETMLDLHRRLPAASTEHARQLLEMQVEQTDREIDALVYDLHGLTPDEISIVEAGAGGNSP